MKLNLRSVDLNLLVVFDELMEAGKLSVVAEQLGMSQPAVSAALQRLRLTFKDELFVRTRSGMLPTARAQALHGDIAGALQLIRRAVAAKPSFDPATVTRHFTILSDIFFESALVGSLLNQLSEEAPGVGIDIGGAGEADPVQALLSLNADVMLDYADYTTAQLSSCRIGEESLVVMVARDHPRVRRSLDLKAFLRENHVILSRRHGLRTSLEHALGGVVLDRRVQATVQHFSSMPMIVAQTHCLATVPKRLGDLYQQAFDVRCFPFPMAANPIPLWMYWPRVLESDPGHRWFRQKLAAVF